MAVVHKPPHWEADTAASAGSRQDAPKLKISEFLRQTFDVTEAPVAHCRELDYGLLHRLDTPSSGLLLVALCHEALFMMRWQRDTVAIKRDYLVLCHGHVPSGLSKVDAPLSSVGPRSEVRAGGRIARTDLQVMGHFWAEPLAGRPLPVSLLQMQPWTGRQHQIRAHLRYVGHPVVCDGRYAQDSFDSDRRWCPRNFIHRWRLGFRGLRGEPCKAEVPLPADLSEVLKGLEPCNEPSAEAVVGWVRVE